MKSFLWPTLLLVGLLVGLVSHAYDTPLGAIASVDGGSRNNFSKFYYPLLYPDAGPYVDGGVTTDGGNAFTIPRGILLGIQCDLPACVTECANGSACTTTCAKGQANTGVYLLNEQLYSVALGPSNNSVAMKPVAGNPDGGAVYCEVFRQIPP